VTKLARFKDTLVHPNSELARLLEAGDSKKIGRHYQKIHNESIARGEFVSRGRKDSKCNYLSIGPCNKCGREHDGDEA
jgi:hypothetical protein